MSGLGRCTRRLRARENSPLGGLGEVEPPMRRGEKLFSDDDARKGLDRAGIALAALENSRARARIPMQR